MAGSGYPILEDERLAALLVDVEEALIYLPDLREELGKVRFVRKQLIARLPEELGYGAKVAE